MSPDAPASQPAQSAADRAHAVLAEGIVSGSLAAGTLITEGEQSGRLGVSRTPVREAFLRLAAEGLLRLYPKKGAVVTAEDDAATRELLEARIMLESESVRARGSSEADESATAAELDALLSAQADALTSGDTLAFARADHAFHARVAAASGNTLVDGFYAQIRPRLERLTHSVVRSSEPDLPRFLSEHRRLVTFLERGDAARYATLLRAHVGLDGPRASGS